MMDMQTKREAQGLKCIEGRVSGRDTVRPTRAWLTVRKGRKQGGKRSKETQEVDSKGKLVTKK